MPETRMTKQRSVILETLRNVCTHPTADEIHSMVRRKMPHISLGTVYRNLDLLATAGEILCLNKAGSQKRFDGNISPHHHVRCDKCGKVGDIFANIPLPQIESAHISGFSIQSCEIEFVGVCDACATK